MRVFTLPKARFFHVAYLDPHRLLASDYRAGGTTYRVWPLGIDSVPGDVPFEQQKVIWQLCVPNAEHFYRRNGLWPPGHDLPPAHTGDSDGTPPALRMPDRWRFAAFGPNGEHVLYAELYLDFGRYRTRFHFQNAPDETTRLFDAQSHYHPCATVSWDGILAAMSGGDRQVAVWDLVSCKRMCIFEPADKVRGLVFAADGRLAVAAGRTVRLWGVPRGQAVTKWPAFQKHVEALAISHDGRFLAAGCRAGTVRLWEVASGGEVARYDWGVGAIRQIAFSPDGLTAAAAGEKGLVVWDLE